MMKGTFKESPVLSSTAVSFFDITLVVIFSSRLAEQFTIIQLVKVAMESIVKYLVIVFVF